MFDHRLRVGAVRDFDGAEMFAGVGRIASERLRVLVPKHVCEEGTRGRFPLVKFRRELVEIDDRVAEVLGAPLEPDLAWVAI